MADLLGVHSARDMVHTPPQSMGAMAIQRQLLTKTIDLSTKHHASHVNA